ncbi:hypothetical protein IMCC12053_859 [Celeribacter marinus]|uniref:Uncharacterized protein n=1 Tax=Celeribacter marinus TaxID=1397108 RepID=A0A0P0A8L6_9RHOB|nr:hypothetical protein IMCC12053_859 [Celeribacter marinus]
MSRKIDETRVGLKIERLRGAVCDDAIALFWAFWAVSS